MSDLSTMFEQLDAIHLAVMVFAAAGATSLVVAVRLLSGGPRPDALEERLRRVVEPMGEKRAQAQVEARSPHRTSPLAPIARVACPTDAEELGRLRAKLAHAGLRGERALMNYLAAKVILGLAVAGLFLWLNSFWGQEAIYVAFFTLCAMALGFYLPAFWLRSRIQERQKEINQAIPNALDLLVTCVEAGLGLEAALDRVAGEARLFSPLLSKELSHASLEMRAGASRGDAFRRLAERTGVDELRNLAAIIVQTQIFGTSIGDSLRIQAESMRIRRMNYAEERAAEAGVKMSIPLVLCITPSLFAVLLGPAVVRIYQQLLPVFMGG